MKKLTRIVVIAITLLMALSLVGCSKGGDTGTDTPTDEPKSFTFAIGDQPNYMDPAIASDSIGSYVINQMFFPLYYLSNEGLMPGAAEDCQVSDDELVYTIKLR